MIQEKPQVLHLIPVSRGQAHGMRCIEFTDQPGAKAGEASRAGDSQPLSPEPVGSSPTPRQWTGQQSLRDPGLGASVREVEWKRK